MSTNQADVTFSQVSGGAGCGLAWRVRGRVVRVYACSQRPSGSLRSPSAGDTSGFSTVGAVVAVCVVPSSAGCVVAVGAGEHVEPAAVVGVCVDLAIVTSAGCVYRVPVRVDIARKRRRGSDGAGGAGLEDDNLGEKEDDVLHFGPTEQAVTLQLGDMPTHGTLKHAPSHRSTTVAALPSGDVLVVTLHADERWIASFAHPLQGPSGGTSGEGGGSSSGASDVVLDVARVGGADEDVDDSTPPHVSVVHCSGDDYSGDGAHLHVDLFKQVFGASASSPQCLVALPTGRIFTLDQPSAHGHDPRPRLIMSIDGAVCTVLAMAGDDKPAESPPRAPSRRSSSSARDLRIHSALLIVARSGRLQTVRAGPAGTPIVTDSRIDGPLDAAVSSGGSSVVFMRADGGVGVMVVPMAPSAPPVGLSDDIPTTLSAARVDGVETAWLALASRHTVVLGLQQSADPIACDIEFLVTSSNVLGVSVLPRGDEREGRAVDTLRADVVELTVAKKRVDEERALVEQAIANVNVALHLKGANVDGSVGKVACSVCPIIPTPVLRAAHPLAVAVTIRGLPIVSYSSRQWCIVVLCTSTREQRAATTSRTIPLPMVLPAGGELRLECPIDAHVLPAIVRVDVTCDLGRASAHRGGPLNRHAGRATRQQPSADIVVVTLARQELDVLDFLMDVRSPLPFDNPIQACELPEMVAAAINARGTKEMDNDKVFAKVGVVGGGGSDTGHACLHCAQLPLPRNAVAAMDIDSDGKGDVLKRVLTALGCGKLLGDVLTDGDRGLTVTARTTSGVPVKISGANDVRLRRVVLSVSAGTRATCDDICASMTDRAWRYMGRSDSAGYKYDNSGGGGGASAGVEHSVSDGGSAASAGRALGHSAAVAAHACVPFDRLVSREQAVTHAYVCHSSFVGCACCLRCVLLFCGFLPQTILLSCAINGSLLYDCEVNVCVLHLSGQTPSLRLAASISV